MHRSRTDTIALIALAVAVGAGTGAIVAAQDLGLSAALSVALVILLGTGIAAAVEAGIIVPLRARADQAQTEAATAAATVAHHRHLSETVRVAAEAIRCAGTFEEVNDLLERTALELVPDREVRCHAVAEHQRCRASREARTVESPSTRGLGACPHVLERCDDLAMPQERSVICVPIGGSAPIAVLTLIGAPEELLEDPTRQALEMVATHASLRLSALQASPAPVVARDGVVGKHDPAAPEPDIEIRDPLTGLPNHLSGHRHIRSLIGSLTPFAVSLCDVDNFAGFNDRHGPEEGDRALRRMARLLVQQLRPGDHVCRVGPDVFLAVFPNCSALHARQAMERVREAVALDLAATGAPPFTFSAGIADSYRGTSIDELLDAAADAVDAAKVDGGNRVKVTSVDVHPSPPR
jgi:diguanylate cyclase (GGDEF)-like protein